MILSFDFTKFCTSHTVWTLLMLVCFLQTSVGKILQLWFGISSVLILKYPWSSWDSHITCVHVQKPPPHLCADVGLCVLGWTGWVLYMCIVFGRNIVQLVSLAESQYMERFCSCTETTRRLSRGRSEDRGVTWRAWDLLGNKGTWFYWFDNFK